MFDCVIFGSTVQTLTCHDSATSLYMSTRQIDSLKYVHISKAKVGINQILLEYLLSPTATLSWRNSMD